MALRPFACLCAALLGAVGCIQPTNPYDPQTPRDLQAKGRIIGRIVVPGRDAGRGPITLHVEDSAGLPVTTSGGAPLAVETRASDDPPAGLDDGEGAPFEVRDLVPGTYAVTFDALENGEPLVSDARSESVSVGPGETKRRDLTPTVRDLRDVTGAVTGEVTVPPEGGTVFVRLLAASGNASLTQTAIVSGGGSFRFEHVPAGEYRALATGDELVPTASALVTVGTEVVALTAPLTVTTLGNVFFLDDFSADASPPFSPFVAASPVHVAVAPIVVLDDVIVQARTFSLDDGAAAPGDFVDLTGVDAITQAFDDMSADGPRAVAAQLRVCFATCADDALVPPVMSSAFPLPFVLDTTAPRALNVKIGEALRADFSSLPGEPPASTMTLGCAAFGDAECAAITGTPDARLAVTGDLVDDTSRVHGVTSTLDDETEPTALAPVGALGTIARVNESATPIAFADGTHTLRLWAQDAAANIGVVDVRAVTVDVTPIELAANALVAVSGVVPFQSQDVAPGAQVVLDVQTVGELPAQWRLVANGADATVRAANIGQFVPYTGPVTLDVDGAHGDHVRLDVDVVDGAGNLTRRSGAFDVTLARTGSIFGVAALENRTDVAGAIITLRDEGGGVLVQLAAGDAVVAGSVPQAPDLEGSFALDGSYTFDGVPVAVATSRATSLYTIEVDGPAPYESASTVVEVAPPGAVAANDLVLTLPRGALAGRFVLEGRESAPTNSGIQVTVLGSLGQAVGAALTLADGSWTVTDLPVGTGYTAIGFFAGYVQEEVPGVTVATAATTVVLPDGGGRATPIVLTALTGDFLLCAVASTFEESCDTLLFTNASEVQIGGIPIDNVVRYRLSTTTFARDAVDPPFVDVSVLPRVALGPAEGLVRVFYQQEFSSGDTGDVLDTSLTYDVTPPANATVAIDRGFDARADGFTNGAVDSGATPGLNAVVRVTANPNVSNGGAGSDVAPLGSALVQFAIDAPGAPGGLAEQACLHGSACVVPLDDGDERPHTAFAFSCDRAGNCTAPASATVVLDTTPPRGSHGVDFAPVGTGIVQDGARFFSRSAQFSIAVDTGTARTSSGVLVTDISGAPVSDVFATKFGLSPFVDDATLTDIPAPLPQANQTRTVPGIALPPFDAIYQIFGQFIDAAGNASSVEPNLFGVDLVLDTRGPSVTFSLNNNAAVTASTTVQVSLLDGSLDPAVRIRLNQTGIFDEADPTTFDERDLPLVDDTFDLVLPPAPDGDGFVTVFAQLLDTAGNVTERADTIFVDRTPPSVLAVGCLDCSEDPAGVLFTNDGSHQVVLNTLAVDNFAAVARVRTTVHRGPLSGLPTVDDFTSNSIVTLSVISGGLPNSTDGAYDIDVEFIDVAGNTSAPVTIAVTLDTVAPTPTLTINGGNDFTRTTAVSLAITGASDVVGMRLQNTAATFSGAQQPLSTEVAWQLANPAVDESKLVFLEATDAAGNVSVRSDSVTLDTRAPTGTVTIVGGARVASPVANVNLAYDLNDAREHAITVTDPGFPADCAGVTFTNAPPPASTQVTFAGTAGEPEARTVWVCTRDRAGNVALAFDNIVLDEDSPTGTVVLNAGASFTTSRTLAPLISAPLDTAQMSVRLDGPLSAPTFTPPTFDCAAGGTVYTAFDDTPTAVIPPASGAGLYAFQVCLRDSAGNPSASAVLDQIVFDGAAPTISVTANGGAAFTTNPTVTLAITAGDDLSSPVGGIAGMRLSTVSGSFTGATEPLVTERTMTVAAPTTEESKTLCVEVTDAAGRTAFTCDTITLDLSPPTGTVTIARSLANFSTDGDSALSTTFRSTDPSIASVSFGQAPLDCAAIPAASFQALAVNTNLASDVAVASGEGTRSVTGCFKAQSGLLSAVTDTVFVDPQDPPLAQFVAPANNAILSSALPTFSWAAVNGASTYTLIVRDVQAPNTVRLTQTNIATTSFTPAVALPQNALEWIVVAHKPSGRSSAQTFTAAPRLTIDTSAPSFGAGQGALAIAVHGTFTRLTPPSACSATRICINDPFATLSFTPATDVVDASVSQIVEVALNGDFTSPTVSLTRIDGGPFDIPIPLSDGTYRFRVRGIDDAGNSATSQTVDFIVDRSAPTPPTLFPAPDPVSQTVASGIMVGWTNEGASGAANYRFELTTEALGFATPLLSATQATTTRDVDGLLTAGANVRHLMRVASIDALGNQSAFTFSSFIHDSVAPCTSSSSLDLVGTDAGGNFTDSSVVTVAISCLGDNPFRMQLGCDGTAAGKPFVPFANTATCVLPPGQGARTVAVIISDQAGNAHNVPSDTVTVDTADPTAPVLATQDTVTGDPGFNIAIEEVSIDTNLLGHEFINGVDVTTFLPVVGTSFPVFVSPPENRTYNVRVRGVDLAGNTSAESLVKITYDDIPPTDPVILGGATQQFVNSPTFTFNLETGSSDPHFDTYETASCINPACLPGPFTANPGNGTFTFTLTGDRLNRFFVRGRDLAGNVSGFDVIEVVEDSRNPRPVELEPLPRVVLGGSPVVIAGFTSGAYVDVFLHHSDTDIAPLGIDDNFDHFEVRATAPQFLGFVPMCEAATPLCPIPFRNDIGDTFDQSTLLITQDNFLGHQIVGFRVPLVRGAENTIVLRSVDKAGNVSLETTTTTREITDQRVTDDDNVEVAPEIFGNRIAFIDDGTDSLVIKEPGPDMLWGTGDDVRDEIVGATPPFNSFLPMRELALGPNFVAYSTGQVFTRITGVDAGPDGSFGTAGDNVMFTVSNDGGGVVVDEGKPAQEPAMWIDRIVWREMVSASDSDVIVREAGPDRVLGNGDDTFARISDDPTHQLFPTISGDNIAFFTCSNADQNQCGPGGTPMALTVVHAGADDRFGTGDDSTTVLTQAQNLSAMRPVLYTPGTSGRAACKNVLAYASDGPTKGVQVISVGPEGRFDVNDAPVQVMPILGGRGGAMRRFAMSDEFVAAGDSFAPPRMEVTWAGRDGCLTRTTDNLSFDSLVDGDVKALHGNQIVARVFDPTDDLVVMEIGAERPIWMRRDAGMQTLLNGAVDRRGVAYGSGAVYDFASRSLRGLFTGSHEAGYDQGTWTLAPGAVFGGGLTELEVRTAGADELFGTGDDGPIFDITNLRDVHVNSNISAGRGTSHGVDEKTIVWAGKRLADAQVVPVVHTAGANGVFEQVGVGGSDDCEVETNAPPSVGYQDVRISGSRMAFAECGGADCGFNARVFAREVVGDVCSGTQTTTEIVPFAQSVGLEGEALYYTLNEVHAVLPGPDRRLTTTGDNVERVFFTPVGTPFTEPGLATSGDHVYFIDRRSQVSRITVGDLADMSTRVLTRTASADFTPTVDGSVVHYALGTSATFVEFSSRYVFGVEPDLPQDLPQAPPTRLRCPSDDLFEENDSQLTAQPVNAGAAWYGIMCEGDTADRYSVTVAENCTIRVRLHPLDANGDIDVALHDPADVQRAQSTLAAGADELITLSPTVAGTYTIRIFRFSGVGTEYDAGVNVSCP